MSIVPSHITGEYMANLSQAGLAELASYSIMDLMYACMKPKYPRPTTLDTSDMWRPSEAGDAPSPYVTARGFSPDQINDKFYWNLIKDTTSGLYLIHNKVYNCYWWIDRFYSNSFVQKYLGCFPIGTPDFTQRKYDRCKFMIAPIGTRANCYPVWYALKGTWHIAYLPLPKEETGYYITSYAMCQTYADASKFTAGQTYPSGFPILGPVLGGADRDRIWRGHDARYYNGGGYHEWTFYMTYTDKGILFQRPFVVTGDLSVPNPDPATQAAKPYIVKASNIQLVYKSSVYLFNDWSPPTNIFADFFAIIATPFNFVVGQFQSLVNIMLPPAVASAAPVTVESDRGPTDPSQLWMLTKNKLDNSITLVCKKNNAVLRRIVSGGNGCKESVYTYSDLDPNDLIYKFALLSNGNASIFYSHDSFAQEHLTSLADLESYAPANDPYRDVRTTLSVADGKCVSNAWFKDGFGKWIDSRWTWTIEMIDENYSRIKRTGTNQYLTSNFTIPECDLACQLNSGINVLLNAAKDFANNPIEFGKGAFTTFTNLLGDIASLVMKALPLNKISDVIVQAISIPLKNLSASASDPNFMSESRASCDKERCIKSILEVILLIMVGLAVGILFFKYCV